MGEWDEGKDGKLWLVCKMNKKFKINEIIKLLSHRALPLLAELVFL